VIVCTQGDTGHDRFAAPTFRKPAAQYVEDSITWLRSVGKTSKVEQLLTLVDRIDTLNQQSYGALKDAVSEYELFDVNENSSLRWRRSYG
jgi:hypothetical protein